MSMKPDGSTSATPWHPVTMGDDGGSSGDSRTVDRIGGAAGTTQGSPIPELEERYESISDAHGLTPGKPVQPTVVAKSPTPTPIEVDEVDLVPAVTMPDAAETFPTAPVTAEHAIGGASRGVTTDAGQSGATPVSPYLAAYTPASGTHQVAPPAGNATDADARAEAAPVTGGHRTLAPSAAALLSAGDLSELDDSGPAFVPRFEAQAEADDALVSSAALAGATVDDSDEPAYTPQVAAPPSAPTPIVVIGAAEAQTDETDAPLDATPEDDMANETQDVATEAQDGAPTDAETSTAAAPAAEPETETDTDGGDSGFPVLPPVDGEGRGKDGGSGSIWTSTAFLVIIGVIGMAIVGAAIYFLFFKPTDVVLPAQTTISAPPATDLEPVVPAEGSAFLAALPTEVGPWVLADYSSVAADTVSPDDPTLPEGVAEQVTLTYTDGTDEITVSAWQHYDINYAQQTFEGLNVEGTNPQPVMAGGEEVGIQVDVPSDAGPTVLWMNNTAVFSAAGPEDALHPFVAQFGL
jgi:hypothetical protein